MFEPTFLRVASVTLTTVLTAVISTLFFTKCRNLTWSKWSTSRKYYAVTFGNEILFNIVSLVVQVIYFNEEDNPSSPLWNEKQLLNYQPLSYFFAVLYLDCMYCIGLMLLNLACLYRFDKLCTTGLDSEKRKLKIGKSISIVLPICSIISYIWKDVDQRLFNKGTFSLSGIINMVVFNSSTAYGVILDITLNFLMVRLILQSCNKTVEFKRRRIYMMIIFVGIIVGDLIGLGVMAFVRLAKIESKPSALVFLALCMAQIHITLSYSLLEILKKQSETKKKKEAEKSSIMENSSNGVLEFDSILFDPKKSKVVGLSIISYQEGGVDSKSGYMSKL